MSSASLLRKAAKALDAGEDPFAGAWLRDNDVSFDQCMDLAEHLALGARIVARGIENPRSEEGQALVLTIARGAS
jgi:hypothetical protein